MEFAFVVLDGDASTSPPQATGGSPIGVWVVRRMTMYLPIAEAQAVDLGASRVEGTLWLAFDERGYRFAADFASRMVTRSSGTITLGFAGDSTGTYAVDGPKIQLTRTCTDGGRIFNDVLEFSAEGQDDARLVARLVPPDHGPQQERTIMLDLSRVR
jgi:hypothetical protein